uniref:Uncharacterized protein n=1 Tax=Amphimedon queenslandica TaxID=400682 RepID=A0A1X7VML4_AMPQE
MGQRCFFVRDKSVSGEALFELLPLAGLAMGGDWGEGGGSTSPLFERERDEIFEDPLTLVVPRDLVSELDFERGRPNFGGLPILGAFVEGNRGVAPLDRAMPIPAVLTPPPSKERITNGLDDKLDKRVASSGPAGAVAVRTIGLLGTELLRNEFEGSSDEPDLRLRGILMSR